MWLHKKFEKKKYGTQARQGDNISSPSLFFLSFFLSFYLTSIPGPERSIINNNSIENFALYLPTTSVHFWVLICAPLVPNSVWDTVWTVAYPIWPEKKPVPATTASVLLSVELNDVRCPKISYVVSTKSPGKSMMTVAWMRYLMPPSTMYCPSNFPNASEPGLACLVMTVSVTRITPFCSLVKSPPGPTTMRALALGTKIESCT